MGVLYNLLFEISEGFNASVKMKFLLSIFSKIKFSCVFIKYT